MNLLKREPVKYIPEVDRELPESEQTVFMIRPLTQSEYGEFHELILKSTAKAALYAAKTGIVSIANYKGSVDDVHFNVMLEVGWQVNTISNFDEETLGNSSSPPVGTEPTKEKSKLSDLTAKKK